MASTDQVINTQENSENTDKQVKTIFNILSKLKEPDSIKTSEVIVSENTSPTEEYDDIVILRRDPKTKQSSINKSAYLKLHRSLSPSRSSSIDRIKEKLQCKADESIGEVPHKKGETIESIKNKYSPAAFGYNIKPINSKVPVPKPRRTRLTKSQIIAPTSKDCNKNDKPRYSLNIDKNSKRKDVNSNHLQSSKEDLSGDEEFVTIVTRSDSEESILKFQRELSVFTMDKKKRPNSFRRIFSGKFFGGKDKKKKDEDKNRSYTENYQNESNSFSRQLPYRHTTGTGNKSVKTSGMIHIHRNEKDGTTQKYDEQELERDYPQMDINQLNKFKASNVGQNLPTKTLDGYVPMDKPIYKSNGGSNTYMNMPNIRKYIDTSSSASTLESDRSNLYQNEVIAKSSNQPRDKEKNFPNSLRSGRVTDDRRDTPPRLLETKQDVRLVNPKALIPINSERALPNPYQSNNRLSPIDKLAHSSNFSPKSYGYSSRAQTNNEDEALRRPHFAETYGTVFDSLDGNKQRQQKSLNKNSISPRQQVTIPPQSPSLEPSKLKLPPNREIVSLSPRIRSPIPPDNVSTEKIIATELLKARKSPVPTQKNTKDVIPSHERLKINIDYPDNANYASRDSLLRSADNLLSKPPVAAKPQLKKLPDNSRMMVETQRLSQVSPISMDGVTYRPRISQASPTSNLDRVTTNAVVHIKSPVNRTPTPNNSVQNLSLSPIRPVNIRPSTPSGARIPESPKTTPQKEEIRKSVEAYYWKEIKKLKDQENYDLYLYQMQYGNMLPYGYAEDPISLRRSRSLSPTAQRNGRRSLSLPRDTRHPTNVIPEGYQPNCIPEDQAVNSQQPRSVQQLQFQQQQQHFRRNAPERRTVDGGLRNYENNTNSLYRPIFKRGSLSTPPTQIVDDQFKRKVSFSGGEQKLQSWPTRNGFTKSPPQRRLDKLQSQGDDEVFLPNIPKVINDNRYRYPSNSNFRPDIPNDEMYYNTRQILVSPNGEPMYVARNQNSLYSQHPKADNRYLPSQPDDILYGQPIDTVSPPMVKGLTRHGSIQINEEIYGQRPGPSRMSFQSNIQMRPSVPSTPVSNQQVLQESQYVVRQPNQPGSLKREVILNDDIFGQFGGYVAQSNEVRVSQNLVQQNVYASRQSIADYNNRVREEYYRPQQKQISVNNKVCDIYGQIHDTDAPRVQQSGVVLGQLHRSPGSPPVIRNSYNQLPGRDHFVRNSRLSASANDMYRRVQNMDPRYRSDALYGQIEQTQVQNGNGAPTRPLPPVPQGKKGLTRVVRNNIVSDTESGSDASEIQRILNSSAKTKKRGIFGK